MTRLVLTTVPAVEPLTASEAKARLNLSSADDTVINALIKAARQELDGWGGWLGRALISQTWTMYLGGFSDCIAVPLPPVQSIASIKYIDPDGVEQTLGTGVYQLMPGNPVTIVRKFDQAWPDVRQQDDAVRVAFVAGYGAAGSDVPENIRSAICLRVASLYPLMERNLFVSEDTVEGVGTVKYTVSQNAGGIMDKAIESLLSPYRVW